MEGHVQVRVTLFALAEAQFSVEDLWVRYYGLGGMASPFEVQAYLAGLVVLPWLERSLLAEAMNELLETTAVQIRVPADGEDEADSSVECSRRALGAAGAFLFSAGEQESERLAAVGRTHLVDSAPEGRFDRYTRQATDHFGFSTSIVGLLDDRRLFLKSVTGPFEQDLPREITFCQATIQGIGPLVVTDALNDERFSTCPLVMGQPLVRFYAGYPLRGPGGWNVGTLAILDQEPHDFSGHDERFLRNLARLVEDEIHP